MLTKNLFFLYSLTVVAMASIVLCVFNYNPYTAAAYQLVIFYISVLFALTGILSLGIFYTKISITKKEVVYIIFWPSVRQGFIISLGITALMALKGMRLFDLWVAIPLFLIIILIELFFQTKKRPV